MTRPPYAAEHEEATAEETPRRIAPYVVTTPRPMPLGPQNLAEEIGYEAMAYRDQNTEWGELIASVLEDLAQKVRYTHADSPAQYLTRIAQLDAQIREQWEERGFVAGRHTCPCRAHQD